MGVLAGGGCGWNKSKGVVVTVRRYNIDFSYYISLLLLYFLFFAASLLLFYFFNVFRSSYIFLVYFM